MIYTPLTKKAMIFAYEKHHGQTDKTGVPYIFHPYRVAMQMDDEISTCVALLHDTVEDTGVTLDDLSAEGFPKEVLDAIETMTRDRSLDYFDYIRIVKTNPISRKVKIADLKDNSNKDRLEPQDYDERMIDRQGRYVKAIEILSEE